MATLTIADLDNGKRDLETVDAVANSKADTTPTRYGDAVLTLAGALRRLGWQAPVPYAPGLNVTSSTMTVEKGGIVYRPDPALVPFTTGAWNPDQWRVVQNTNDSNQVYQFASRVEAESAIASLPNGATVLIVSDAEHDGQATENTKSGGTISFDRLRTERVSITAFGGKGDSVFVNDGALRAARAAAGNNGVVHFPRSGGTNYKFEGITFADTDGLSVDADSGVKFTVPDAGHISNAAHWYHAVDVDFVNSTGTCTFRHTPASNKRGAERPLWLGMADRDCSRWKALDATSDLRYYCYDQRTDTREILPVSSAASVFVTSNTDLYLTNFGMLDCLPGDSLSFTAEAPSAITLSVAGIVSCDDRRYWFWSDGHSASNLVPKLATKPVGGAVSVQDLHYVGMDTHESYFMFESVISIRIDGPRKFSILLNGYAIHSQETPSDIREFGCGMQGLGTLSLRDMTVHRKTPMATGRMISGAVWGDSLSANSMPTTWPNLMADMLDASNGVRVTKMDNFAVPGVDSASQLAAMDSVALGSYDYHLILIGTNDIQGQVGVASYISNVNSMVTKALNVGCRVILGVPPLWYTQGQLPGGGGASVNYSKGKFYRSALIRAAAAWDSPRVRLVDIPSAIGPVLANFRNATLDPSLAAKKKDPTVYDTLHLTQNTQVLVARAFGNALLGDIADTGAVAPHAVGLANTGINGWTVSASSNFIRSSDGTVTLGMLLTRSATTPINGAGQIAATIPRAARPKSGALMVAPADGTTCTVAISATGDVVVYSLASGTFVQLQISYAAA